MGFGVDVRLARGERRPAQITRATAEMRFKRTGRRRGERHVIVGSRRWEEPLRDGRDFGIGDERRWWQ